MPVSAVKPQQGTSFVCNNCGEMGAIDSHSRLLHLKPDTQSYTPKCFAPNLQKTRLNEISDCGNECGTRVKWKKTKQIEGNVETYKALLIEAENYKDHYCKPMR